MVGTGTLGGRYQLQHLIGRGSVGDTYLATDLQLQVDVAVKVLHQDLAGDSEFIEQLEREADGLAQLDHPYLARFRTFERDGDTAYIVTDYVPGTTLRAHIAEADRALGLDEATRVLRHVGAALYAAHSAGYVHLDIKPANILLREDGAVLLSDLGIARAAEGTDFAREALSTPAYSSPEQISGEPTGPWTDIYSLGIVLYEVASGHRPFAGDRGSGATVVDRVKDEHINFLPPHPRRLNPDLPMAAGAVILRALEKNPHARWPSVRDMVTAWEEALGITVPVIEEPEQAPLRRSRLIWAIAGVAALLIVVVGVGVAAAMRAVRPSPVPATATGAIALASATSAGTVTLALADTPVATTIVVADPTQTPAAATATPRPPTATATPAATATPSTTPTRDVNVELRDALERYAAVRAESEESLDPELLRSVCVDPYLSWKMNQVAQNRQDGVHWQTTGADFSVTSSEIRDDGTAEVWVSKTETKLFFTAGSDKPDDEVCSGTIYSYRDCTYDAQYILVFQAGSWYVSEANAPGANCATACQN